MAAAVRGASDPIGPYGGGARPRPQPSPNGLQSMRPVSSTGSTHPAVTQWGNGPSPLLLGAQGSRLAHLTPTPMEMTMAQELQREREEDADGHAPCGGPDMNWGLSGALDACQNVECRNPVEDIRDAEEESSYVTRTFYWRPEDFPLEVATYMQTEEPWAARRNMAAMARLHGYKTAGLLKGRECPKRIEQVSADETPGDMLDDEKASREGREVPLIEVAPASSPSPSCSSSCPAPAVASSAAAAPDLLDLGPSVSIGAVASTGGGGGSVPGAAPGTAASRVEDAPLVEFDPVPAADERVATSSGGDGQVNVLPYFREQDNIMPFFEGSTPMDHLGVPSSLSTELLPGRPPQAERSENEMQQPKPQTHPSLQPITVDLRPTSDAPKQAAPGPQMKLQKPQDPEWNVDFADWSALPPPPK